MTSNDDAKVRVGARSGTMVRNSSGPTSTGTVDNGLVDIIHRPESYSVRLTSKKAGEGNCTLLEASRRLIQPTEASLDHPFRNMFKRTTSYVIAHDLNFCVYTRNPISAYYRLSTFSSALLDLGNSSFNHGMAPAT